MTDTLPEAQSKSGLILKAAREEMSLTLEQVANELHLRPSVIKSIEEENYDEFTSDVFLKGYFRTYCRLVNLHETRMMDLLEQQLTVRQKRVEHITEQANKEVQNKKRKKLFVTLAVFFVSISLVAFAYQMSSKTISDAFDVQEKNDGNLQNIDDAKGIFPSENETTSNQEVDIVKINDAEEPTQVSSITGKLNALNEDTGRVEDASHETLKAIDQEESEDVPVIEGPTEKEIPTTIVASLKASFTGECWFKVTDSSGKAVIAALKKADDEINFKGLAPFHIVIGDASKVTLTFQDDLVNLKPFTSRNGRAELTLKPSDSDNEG